MIHTATILTLLTREEYCTLKDNPQAKISPTNEVFLYTVRDYGISRLHAYCKKIDDYHFYYCEAKINLNRITNNGEQTPHPFIVNERNKKLLQENFYRFIFPLLPNKANINSWSVERIDYTIDITTPHVKEYIALLQRGGKPPKTRIDSPKGEDGKEQHRSENDKTHYKNSVRYANESCLLQIYDKFEERKQIDGYPVEMLERCKNILRIELQCFYRKTRTIKRRYAIRGISICSFMLSEIDQKNIFTFYLRNICGYGDYMELTAAVNTVKESRLTGKRKEEIIALLTEINTTKNVRKIKAKYRERLEPILRSLRSLNINPVTIPRRFNIKKLNNLFSEIRRM